MGKKRSGKPSGRAMPRLPKAVVPVVRLRIHAAAQPIEPRI
jgi:hypothetical protein